MIQIEHPILTAAALVAPAWIELPDDLTANILQRLGAKETIESAQLVCSTWWRVCESPAMWGIIHLDSHRCGTDKFGNIYRCVVDLSQGQLVELKLSCFKVDGLLNYAAHRSSQLRCLTLDNYSIIESELIGAIKKLPHLEELHLTSKDPTLRPEDIETIGISCPMLKSFTYNSKKCGYYLVFSDHAAAIGGSMPNLRHLRFCSLVIHNWGPETILDGCPNLESLHLRECHGLDFFGDVGKRCLDQIKDLTIRTMTSTLPYESDYEYDPDFY